VAASGQTDLMPLPRSRAAKDALDFCGSLQVLDPCKTNLWPCTLWAFFLRCPTRICSGSCFRRHHKAPFLFSGEFLPSSLFFFVSDPQLPTHSPPPLQAPPTSELNRLRVVLTHSGPSYLSRLLFPLNVFTYSESSF